LPLNFNFLTKYFTMFIEGAGITILLAAAAVFFGVFLGLFLSLMRLSNIKPFYILYGLKDSKYFGWLSRAANFNPVKFIAVTYIEVIRGTPLLLQILLAYAVLPPLDGVEFIAGVAALSLNSAAYVAEIMRSGIQAVEIGQTEAARSLGMKYGMAMRRIIIPQAIKNILPALGNEFVVVIKESSIVYVLGNVHELMFQTKIVTSTQFLTIEPLLIAGLLYFIITFTTSKLLGKAERRMRRSERK